MATKLKPTPVLEGVHAERFLSIVKKNQSKKATRDEVKSIVDFAANILSKAKI